MPVFTLKIVLIARLQVDLAKRLVESSFGDKVFFCNSGTEANEACIKFVRKFARWQAGVDPYSEDSDAPFECVSFSVRKEGWDTADYVIGRTVAVWSRVLVVSAT